MQELFHSGFGLGDVTGWTTTAISNINDEEKGDCERNISHFS